jgi:hypothetical protein
MVCHLLPYHDVHRPTGLRHGPVLHRRGQPLGRLHRLLPSRPPRPVRLAHQRRAEAPASPSPICSQELGLLAGMPPLFQTIGQVRNVFLFYNDDLITCVLSCYRPRETRINFQFPPEKLVRCEKHCRGFLIDKTVIFFQ